MDVSKERPKTTAGLDLGDRYSYLCLIDTQSGEVIEEGRLRTTPEAFGRRFASEQQAQNGRDRCTEPGPSGSTRSEAALPTKAPG
jgi:hypothetical protein